MTDNEAAPSVQVAEIERLVDVMAATYLARLPSADLNDARLKVISGVRWMAAQARAYALEEAAKVVERRWDAMNIPEGLRSREVAKAIRALIHQPTASAGKA